MPHTNRKCVAAVRVTLKGKHVGRIKKQYSSLTSRNLEDEELHKASKQKLNPSKAIVASRPKKNGFHAGFSYV
jgi:hypothetical protein